MYEPAKSTSRHRSATSSPWRRPVNAAVRKIAASCSGAALGHFWDIFWSRLERQPSHRFQGLLSAPARIRTWDLRIRSPLLYPAELRGRTSSAYARAFGPRRLMDWPPVRRAACKVARSATRPLRDALRDEMTKKAPLSLAALVTTAAAAFALLPATAGAKTGVRVGIGDQQASMFDQPLFQARKFKRVRYFVRWDVMKTADERLAARRYIQRAREDGISVLLHISSDDLRIKRAHLPSVSAFRTQVRRLVPYFRKLGVREFGAWNEVNHASQPTYRSPTRAADFFVETYRAVRPRCSFCTVVALDVLDQRGVERYMRSWYRHLSSTYRRRATIVGIHNYGDVNRQRTTFTRNIIQESHHYNSHTKFWFTETGGIVKFGRSFPCNTTRARNRLRNMFDLAKTYHSSGVERMYVYNWTAPPDGCDARFDAGLVNFDGTARPGYTYLRQKLPNFLR